MKGSGIFRGIIKAATDRFRKKQKAEVIHYRADAPRVRHHNVKHKPRKRLKLPECIPGTYPYHDVLVRNFGRKEADKMGERIRNGEWSSPEWIN